MSVDIGGRLYTWNAAVCVACWNQRNPLRLAEPVAGGDAFLSGEVERCCYCGGGTTSGIYVRADPRTVPFPRLDADDFHPSETLALPLSDAVHLELQGQPLGSAAES